MSCPDCKGKGTIELLTSVVECEACKVVDKPDDDKWTFVDWNPFRGDGLPNKNGDIFCGTTTETHGYGAGPIRGNNDFSQRPEDCVICGKEECAHLSTESLSEFREEIAHYDLRSIRGGHVHMISTPKEKPSLFEREFLGQSDERQESWKDKFVATKINELLRLVTQGFVSRTAITREVDRLIEEGRSAQRDYEISRVISTSNGIEPVYTRNPAYKILGKRFTFDS